MYKRSNEYFGVHQDHQDSHVKSLGSQNLIYLTSHTQTFHATGLTYQLGVTASDRSVQFGQWPGSQVPAALSSVPHENIKGVHIFKT